MAADLINLPGKASIALAEAIAAEDLDMAADCFARDACFITPDATLTSGRDGIRPILAQLIGAGAQIEIEASSMILAGEVAVGVERWCIRFRGVNGTPLRQTPPESLVVIRRIQDRWRLAIAAPWGFGNAQSPTLRSSRISVCGQAGRC